LDDEDDLLLELIEDEEDVVETAEAFTRADGMTTLGGTDLADAMAGGAGKGFATSAVMIRY
jgi:hypothetical protein